MSPLSLEEGIVRAHFPVVARGIPLFTADGDLLRVEHLGESMPLNFPRSAKIPLQKFNFDDQIFNFDQIFEHPKC